MTTDELARLRTLELVRDGALSRREAADRLRLGERQLRRLLDALRLRGPAAATSRRRGQPPNNRIPEATRSIILERYRGAYAGFGPTLLAQTLADRDRLIVSRESLRTLLTDHGLWKTRKRRHVLRPLRQRRSRFGELIQIDGSPHDWFEDRGPRCTLLLAIDDATSRVTAGGFESAETTDGYYRLLRLHLQQFGRFLAAYSDKHSIFRYSGPSTNEHIPQLHRSLDELEIELICANSPQAKGRVERANRTFQDRLIKTMRLEAISTITRANQFLPGFIDDHNRRFAIAPACDQDAHRTLDGFDLDQILCRHEERVLTRQLMFQIDDICYAVVDPDSRRGLQAGSRLQIHLHPNGQTTVHHRGRRLSFEPVGKLERKAVIVGAKDLNPHLDRRTSDPKKVRTPAPTHPWKRLFLATRPKPDISALQKPDITALR